MNLCKDQIFTRSTASALTGMASQQIAYLSRTGAISHPIRLRGILSIGFIKALKEADVNTKRGSPALYRRASAISALKDADIMTLETQDLLIIDEETRWLEGNETLIQIIRPYFQSVPCKGITLVRVPNPFDSIRQRMLDLYGWEI